MVEIKSMKCINGFDLTYGNWINRRGWGDGGIWLCTLPTGPNIGP